MEALSDFVSDWASYALILFNVLIWIHVIATLIVSGGL